MDKGYEKEGFETLKIKASVAKKFRKFSRRMSKSQSMSLLLMIGFFESNGISPIEELGPNMEALETRISNLIKKRMNGMIAIMKDIEKTQTKPSVAMLQALFQATEPPKKKLMLEENDPYAKKQVRFREKININSKND
ncbi:BfmA/BtgA family mobilization protein [Dokdonia sp. Asnod1-B02]|uniref:BfmA/BtgA family mobilization protein n=1 Tax=Dokdonia sp. Asnod1-B02 TaxID=3160573 RepID=UPI003870A46B